MFAAPDHTAAREVLAAALEQLGNGAENATWRNAFLTGARELRTGTVEHTALNSAGLAPALTVTQLFDSIAIRIVGPKAWDGRLTIAWHVTDLDEHYHMELSNGALIHRRNKAPVTADKRQFRPKAGTVLLFPASLLHWVHPNDSNSDRLTVAFNGRFRLKRQA